MALPQTIYESPYPDLAIPTNLSWPQFACRQNPDDVADDEVVLQDLEEPNDWLTYAGVRQRAGIGAAWLQSIGLKPGEFVAIYATNSVAWATAAYAVLWAGGVLTGINAIVSEYELPHYLAVARPRFIFVDPSLRERTERVFSANSLPACRIIELGTSPGRGFPYDIPQTQSISPWQMTGDNRQVPAIMLFSSGQ